MNITTVAVSSPRLDMVDQQNRGAGKWRTVWILVSIAAAFFAGIIVKVWLFGPR